jgi:hypothetical protein
LTGENRGGGEKKLTESLTLTSPASGEGRKKELKEFLQNFLPIDGGG